MLRKEEKTAIINANRTHETDTGSPERSEERRVGKECRL